MYTCNINISCHNTHITWIYQRNIYAFILFWNYILTVQCDAVYNGTHCFRIVLAPHWIEYLNFYDHEVRSAAQGGRIAELITEEIAEAVKPISIQSK